MYAIRSYYAGVIYPEATLTQIGELLERKSAELGHTIYAIS